jgi:RNA polymerase sigma factor (TIGR02999 family)
MYLLQMSDPAGDLPTTDSLFPIVYEELKRLARHQLRVGGPGTLCTTELVHEAYLKLSPSGGAAWQERAHFFGAAARAMRHILVDFARNRGAAKRGGGWRLVSLDDATIALQVELEDMLALDGALDQLEVARS